MCGIACLTKYETTRYAHLGKLDNVLSEWALACEARGFWFNSRIINQNAKTYLLDEEKIV